VRAAHTGLESPPAALGTRDGPRRRVQEKRGQEKKPQQKGAQ
jgi:hypothetical protein